MPNMYADQLARLALIDPTGRFVMNDISPPADPSMVLTDINERWQLFLPAHRAARPEWGRWTDPQGNEHIGWESERLASMHDEIKRLLTANPERRPVLVDVGVEEGDLTALFSSWGCDVVMVEPNPRVWPNVRAIWEANELRPPLAWWVGFAGAAIREVDNPLWQVAAAPDPEGEWPECAHGPVIGDHAFLHLSQHADMVPTITLDDIAFRHNHEEGGGDPITVDIITIDCEGSELLVLQGAFGVLLADQPTVFVSVHQDEDWMTSEYPAAGYGEIDRYMLQFGYSVEHLATDHEAHYRWYIDDRPEPSWADALTGRR